MGLKQRFLCNGVGAKFIVALTGLALTGFVLAHLSGNLLLFAGPEAMNAYAANLKKLGALLWVARAGLLLAAVVHIGLAIKLNIDNRKARPIKYSCEKTMEATFASRYMAQTGLLLFAFIAYHLAHFTFRVVGDADTLPPEDVYGMVVQGFSNPVISGFYVFAMGVLALHLRHGVSSVFQTLGVNHPNINKVRDLAGPVVAAIVFFGFSSLPIAVLTGCIR